MSHIRAFVVWIELERTIAAFSVWNGKAPIRGLRLYFYFARGVGDVIVTLPFITLPLMTVTWKSWFPLKLISGLLGSGDCPTTCSIKLTNTATAPFFTLLALLFFLLILLTSRVRRAAVSKRVGATPSGKTRLLNSQSQLRKWVHHFNPPPDLAKGANHPVFYRIHQSVIVVVHRWCA